jgi:hypothetical protein
MAVLRDDETVVVTDLYEAAYLVLEEARLEAVECIRLSGSLACSLKFSGKGLLESQDEYFSKRAVVNLYAFRQAYNQVNSLVHQAKKNYTTKGTSIKDEGFSGGTL